MDSNAAPRTLGSQVADRVRDAIIRGELPSGQPLKQAELAARFGVSPIPLREGLRLLEAERFVTFHPFRGATVTPASPHDLRDLIDMFLALQTLALRRAFKHLTCETFRQAEEVLAAMRKCGNFERWGALSLRFPLTLGGPAGRPRLLETIRGLLLSLGRYRLLGLSREEHRERYERGCREVLGALRAGDLEGAVRQLEQHLGEVTRAPLAHLEEAEAQGRLARRALNQSRVQEAES